MLKPLSILLSALVLVQSARLDMSDIAQLDELLEHAKFHAEKYGDNFQVFMSKHYGELQQDHERDHQEEQGEHEELPFNHHSCQHAPAHFVLLSKSLPLLKAIPITDVSLHFYYQETYASLEPFDIFQPPRHT